MEKEIRKKEKDELAIFCNLELRPDLRYSQYKKNFIKKVEMELLNSPNSPQKVYNNASENTEPEPPCHKSKEVSRSLDFRGNNAHNDNNVGSSNFVNTKPVENENDSQEQISFKNSNSPAFNYNTLSMENTPRVNHFKNNQNNINYSSNVNNNNFRPITPSNPYDNYDIYRHERNKSNKESIIFFNYYL